MQGIINVKKNSRDSNVIICFIPTPCLNPSFPILLPSRLKPQDYTPTNKSAPIHYTHTLCELTSLARIWYKKYNGNS